MIRVNVLEIPSLAPGATGLSSGAPLGALVDLERGERAVGLTTLDEDGAVALATAYGMVKRVIPEVLTAKDSWEIIRLEEGDTVVGAARLPDAAAESMDLVFITSDAQLLRFPAAQVRPQGRSAAGMVGIRLYEGAHLLAFAAVDPRDGVVVTIAGSSQALPGTDAGTVKVSPLSQFPAKGRATSGVRAHRFRSTEDCLTAAWTGMPPARAASASGVPVELPDVDARRDATGTSVTVPIAGLGGAV
jgi:DNA gyrase subunit A